MVGSSDRHSEKIARQLGGRVLQPNATKQSDIHCDWVSDP